jgi:hypothetical protein
MGYHVSILLTQDGKQVPLQVEKVKELVSSMPHARIEVCSLTDGDLDLVIETADSNTTRLVMQHGKLWTKNPSDTDIKTMIEVAARLGARVRGDEMETYRSDGTTYVHPDDEERHSHDSVAIRREVFRSRLIPNVIKIVAFLVLLGGLVATYLRKQ